LSLAWWEDSEEAFVIHCALGSCTEALRSSKTQKQASWTVRAEIAVEVAVAAAGEIAVTASGLGVGPAVCGSLEREEERQQRSQEEWGG